MLTSQLRNHIATALEQAKAQDVLLLDVTGLTDTTDYMMICTGTSGRHVASIAATVQAHLSTYQRPPLGSEGVATMEWILLDYVEVVVHIMRRETRRYYDLESLWDTRLAQGAGAVSA